MLLNTKKLAAILTHAAVRDVRYYLNGVLAERRGGVLRLVATDGHRILCWKVGPDEGPDFEVIMPSEFVKACAKVKSGYVQIDVEGAKLTCVQAGALATAIDGKFPDWRRVLHVSAGEAIPAAYNADLLADIQKAAKLSGAGAFKWVMQQRGTSAAPFTIGEDMAGVLMPMRADDFSQAAFDSIVR